MVRQTPTIRRPWRPPSPYRDDFYERDGRPPSELGPSPRGRSVGSLLVMSQTHDRPDTAITSRQGAAPPSPPAPPEPGLNEKILFWASFLTLIAAGMGFSIRGDILGDWGAQFGFTQTDLGEIQGMGLVGFGFTIIFFSFFADLVGYGKLMVIGFTLHALAAVTTLAAPFLFAQPSKSINLGRFTVGLGGKEGAFTALYLGQLFFSLGNGTCEAVINPLTAALFPNNKTHWLNILHAGWPGGLVLG